MSPVSRSGDGEVGSELQRVDHCTYVCVRAACMFVRVRVSARARGPPRSSVVNLVLHWM